MSRKVAVYSYRAVLDFTRGRLGNPLPLYRLKPKLAKSLVERGFIVMTSSRSARVISEAFDTQSLPGAHGSRIKNKIESCAIMGKGRAVSGGLMSPGIATVGPRNMAKIPHEMSRHFQGR